MGAEKNGLSERGGVMSTKICEHGVNPKDCQFGCSVTKERSHFLTPQEWHNLNTVIYQFCKGYYGSVFLVGSVLERPNYRDVDVRCITAEQFDEMVYHPPRTVLQVAMSEWLSNRTGLNVDFQFQTEAQAEKEKGTRVALGNSI